ncbi:hypothetical protein PybrP1_009965 [[Pythium] brassicae (nom. inval.)]|nr:hypothetical protein PybrP1_009965 [[Pythium] brassicae (nom. inval.)]
MRPNPRAAAIAGASSSAAADVLANCELWDAITAFMTGYPLAVVTLLQDRTARTKLLHAESQTSHATYHFVGDLIRRGELPHLAIAMNDAAMLHTLFRLAKHPQYARDRRLRFRASMRCAALLNRVEMLQCIDELKHSDDPKQNWSWRASEPNLMRIALQRDDVDTRVLDWLFARLPPIGSNALFVKDMRYHAREGSLSTVVWLREHGCKITQETVDDAARNNQPRVLEYLYQHTRRRCQSNALCHAAEKGYADVVELVVRKQKKHTDARFALDSAALFGHLAIVKFLVGCNVYLDSPEAINYAAANGHLDVVRYLDAHLAAGCTMQAMTSAAENGHLDVVRFLHENRTEGCFDSTLDQAARKGHVGVVKYLLEHYPNLRCSSSGFDVAASQGHLELVEFLHASFADIKCTSSALASASKNGHTDTVAFLLQHRSEAEADVSEALVLAAKRGRLEVAELLHAAMRPGDSVFPALTVASRRGHHRVVKFLCESDSQRREPRGLLVQAVDSGDTRIVSAVQRHLPLEQVIEAREAATARWTRRR